MSCQYGETGVLLHPSSGLPEGLVTLTATLQDYAGNTTEADEVHLTVDTIPPVITLTSPVDGTSTNQSSQASVGSLSEAGHVDPERGGRHMWPPNLSFTHGPVSLQEGLNSFELIATDTAGNSRHLNVHVTLDTVPPAAIDKALIAVDEPEGQVRISGRVRKC